MKKLYLILAIFLFYSHLIAQDKSKNPTVVSFANIQVAPDFPGGPDELKAYIDTQLKYPSEAVVDKIEGTVILEFIVTKMGNIESIKIYKSVHPLLDEEAKRLVKSMPKWSPGKNEGQDVNAQYVLPIKFYLK